MPDAARVAAREVVALVEREHILDGGGGARLDVLELAPPAPRATVVAGHAMMVDRRTLWRRNGSPSLGSTLVAHGFRVLLPDLRGHGRSGPTPSEGGDWRYDDLVRDTEHYLALAARLDDAPVVLLGHSLFGHTALAYLGTHPDARVRALVLVAVNVWARRWTVSWWRWLGKALIMGLAGAVTRLAGCMPARRFGVGSADEARGYWLDLERFVRTGRWHSHAASPVDYAAQLATVRPPVLHVVSDGDRWYANPEDALRFGAALPAREVLRVGPSSAHAALRGLDLDHMPLVTSPKAEPVWESIASWIEARLGAAAESR